MGHGGKGDTQRPRQITAEEENLRWELAFNAANPKRKEEILKRLDEIKKNTK